MPAVEEFNRLAREMRAGRFDVACTQVVAFQQRSPGFFGAHHLMGLCDTEAGRLDKANAHFRAALRLRPDFADSRVNLANNLARLGQLPLAVQEYRQVLARDPGHSGAKQNLMALARLLLAGSQPAEALKALAGLEQNAEWHALAGYAEYKLGRAALALEHLQKALELDPKSEDGWLKIGEMLLFYQSPAAAVAYFSRGARELPQSTPIRLGLAVALLATDTDAASEEALAHLEAIRKADPHYEPALEVLCRVFQRRQQTKELAETAAEWRARNPQSSEAHFYLAVAAGEAPEAERWLKEALRLNPASFDALIALSKRLLQQGQVQDAIVLLERGAELRPADPQPHYLLARAWREAGNAARSRLALEAFQQRKSQEQPWSRLLFELAK